MVILGIDPGFHYSGFGVLKKDQRAVYLLDYGCLTLSPSKSLSTRTGLFYEFFKEKIVQWQITDVALETPFLAKNAQNFLKLGYLRGTTYLLAHQHTLQLHEFSPREVKQTVTGYGGAQKDQVARMVLQFFPGMKPPYKADITDALAVTLCGLWSAKAKQIS